MKSSKRWIILVGCMLFAVGIVGFFSGSLDSLQITQSRRHAVSDPKVLDPSERISQGNRSSAPANPAPTATSPQNPVAEPSLAETSVWARLGKVEVLETKQTALEDGSFRRSRLLKIEGKYPLVIFQGVTPVGNPDVPDHQMRGAVAMVADHLLVRPREEVSDENFRAAVTSLGLKQASRLSPESAWVVDLSSASLGDLETAIARLQSDARIAYAEPDYLVFPTDVPSATIQLEMRDGALVPSDANEPSVSVGKGKAYHFDAVSRATLEGERLAEAPPGARILGFDSPAFTGGPSRYNPGLEEQNFSIRVLNGIDVPEGNNPTHPNNGTYHGRSPWNPVTIQHTEGLPFSIFSIDLAELSTNEAVPATISFTGHKVDGGLVTQSFVTDGIIDGIGPLDDFQTFTFSDDFTHLSKIEVSSKSVMDNIVVLVEELESPAPTPPQLPVIYDVTFDAPKHTVGSLSSVSGPFAPSSLKGTPTVRASVGTLTGPALEFKGDLAQEVRFGMRNEAVAYRLELDAYLDLPNDFTLHFDGLSTIAQAISFKNDGKVAVSQNGQITNGVATYLVKKNMHIMVDLDVTNSQWELFINGVSKFKRTLDTSAGDLTDIRMSTMATYGRAGGVDNIRVSAFTDDNAPTLGARLAVSPGSIAFPDLAVGSSLTWNLELSNTGMKTLNIYSVTINNAHFNLPADNAMSLIPGTVVSVPVTFKPTVTGNHQGQITINSDDPYHPTFLVPVAGVGVNAPVIGITPANLDVTLIAGRSGSQAYTIRNSGSTTLRWNLGLSKSTGSAVIPGDPYFASLWGMKTPAPSAGGIDATRAWTFGTGSDDVVIAVIDTGVDRTHPDLQGNIWINPGEIAGNHIDDDENGLVDDVYGWDFCDNDSNPSDPHGHGTHVAGTIAGRGDNGVGVTGVCWNGRIMSLRFLPAVGPGYTSDAIKCVDYATQMGAKLSNNSWGGAGYSEALRDAIAQAGQAGALFVASAGNESLNNDAGPRYPSSYTLENIVAVASTDEYDRLSYFSNYGANSVDLAAPGSNILSLSPGGSYVYRSGTSMAAPHVAGVAGLLMANNPKITPAEIKRLLLFGVDSLAQLNSKVASRGRLNALLSLRAGLPVWLQSNPGNGAVMGAGTQQIALSVDGSTLEPGEYNEMLMLSSNDPQTPTFQLPVKIQVVEENDYTAWVNENFGNGSLLANNLNATVWGDLADADDDGVANLLEYLAGSSPTFGNAQSSRAIISAGERLFEFQARSNDPYVSYDVEWSETLQGTWRRDRLQVVEDSTEGMPAGVHRIRVKITGEAPSSAFFRLAARRDS